MEVGAYLLDHMPNMRVDVKHPDVTLNIEIRNSTYLHSKTIRTYGGLQMVSKLLSSKRTPGQMECSPKMVSSFGMVKS